MIIVLTMMIMMVKNVAALWISPSNMELLGRHHVVTNMSSSFDFIASGVRFSNVDINSSFVLNMDVGCDEVRFGVFGGKEEMFMYEFKGKGKGNKSYSISTESAEIVSVRKVTEPFGRNCGPVIVYGATISMNRTITIEPNDKKSCFIDFYGDSDTAAFGVDGESKEYLKCLSSMSSYENFADGWVKRLFDLLGKKIYV